MIFQASHMRDYDPFPHPAGCAIIAMRNGFAPAGQGARDAQTTRVGSAAEKCSNNERCGYASDFKAKHPQRRVFCVVGWRVGQVPDVSIKIAVHNDTTVFARAYNTHAPARARPRTHVRDLYFTVVTVVDKYFHAKSKTYPTRKPTTVDRAAVVGWPLSKKFNWLADTHPNLGGF